MADYDYGNARVRAMKSRLLKPRDLESLTEAGSLPGLIAALTHTVYQRSIESALTQSTAIQCVDSALKNDLTANVGKLRGFYEGDAHGMIVLLLRSYDLHNLKAILRGLEHNTSAAEILSILLPIGDLDVRTLNQLAGLNDPREAVDVLASMGFAIAQPLLKARAGSPGAEPFALELALDRWYFEEAGAFVKEHGEHPDLLGRAFALDADLLNVLTVLRFAHKPAERERLPQDASWLFIRQGTIAMDVLESARRHDSVAAVVESLAHTTLGNTLRSGLEAYGKTRRLSDVEKHLRSYRLRWMAGHIAKEPLGIGVPLGFIALKVNEIGNIRWIANGINLGLPVESIRAGLEVAA